eukprot:7442289-Lingulodinium_polyedra.AAC.1
MCVELLGSHLDLEYDVAAVYLVLVFGWVGAPGQYMARGWGLQGYHVAHRPPRPEVHDVVSYSSLFLMDDGVLCEPALGVRPWLSEACYVQGMRRCLGPDALNQKKEDIEGRFAEEQL